MKGTIIGILLLSGCSTANVSGQASSFATIGTPPVGSSVGGGSIGIEIQNASAGAVVASVAVLAAMFGIWRGDPPRRAAPELLDGRAINEADCTQPIVDWTKNLRCR